MSAKTSGSILSPNTASNADSFKETPFKEINISINNLNPTVQNPTKDFDHLPNNHSSHVDQISFESLHYSNYTFENLTSGDMGSLSVNSWMLTLFSIIFGVGQANFVMAFQIIRGKLFSCPVTRSIVFNLTVANGTLTLSIPFLLFAIVKRSWVLGSELCKLYWIMEQMNKYSSIVFLTYLCFDRYLAIAQPALALRYRRPGRTRIACICCWIAIGVAMTPVMLFSDHKLGSCRIHWPISASYTTMGTVYGIACFIFLYPIPVGLICILSRQMVGKLRSASKKRPDRRSLNFSKNQSTTHDACSEFKLIQVSSRPPNRANSMPGPRHSHKLSSQVDRTENSSLVKIKARKWNSTRIDRASEKCKTSIFRGRNRRALSGRGNGSQPARYRKVTRVIIVTAASHVILWGPFWFDHIGWIIWKDPPSSAHLVLIKIISFMPYINSAIFPYFYLISNE